MAPTGPPTLDINPPLLNSANPWATTLEDLRGLYACSATGAVTTRTSTIAGFNHDPDKHQYVFFDVTRLAEVKVMGSVVARNNSSLNSLGYSPVPLQGYLDMVKTIARETPSPKRKWFIISVTGTPDDVAASYGLILEAQRGLDLLSFPLAMEVNLSCPNIPGAPPPAYYGPALTEYISAVVAAVKRYDDLHGLRVPVGLKTPPYTHAGEYDTLVEALSNSIESGGLCISFLTATNTLGSCLIDDNEGKVLPGDGLGGMAGSALHPLALGNVKTLRTRLDQQPRGLGHIQVIGVGGVDDWYGYCRMRAAGASAVGIGTALGMYGLDVFKGIEEIAAGKWDIMDR